MDGEAPTRLRAGRGASIAATNLPGRLPGVKGKAGGRPRWSLLLWLVLLAACAGPRLRPASPGGTGAIAQEMPPLRISVEAEAWYGRPRSLPDHVLPFRITLGNTGRAPVTITRADFLLLDDANRQYPALAPSEVITLLGGRGPAVGVSPSVGVSGSTAGGTAVGVGLGIVLGSSGTDTRDIIGQALAEGPLLPGAEAKGFVYFPRPAPGYKSLRVVVAPQAIPAHPRLDFEFRLSRS